MIPLKKCKIPKKKLFSLSVLNFEDNQTKFPISSAIKTNKTQHTLTQFRKPYTENELDWPEIMRDRHRREIWIEKSRLTVVQGVESVDQLSWVSFNAVSLGTLGDEMRPSPPFYYHCYFLWQDMGTFFSIVFKIVISFRIYLSRKKEKKGLKRQNSPHENDKLSSKRQEGIYAGQHALD